MSLANNSLQKIFAVLAASPSALNSFRQALLSKHEVEYKEALRLSEAAVFDTKLVPLAAKQLGQAQAYADMAEMAARAME